MGWKQDKYELVHPEKYIGDAKKLIYKSSWEQDAFKVCDNNPYVLEWGYEIAPIPYTIPGRTNPQTRVMKKYFPDLYIVTQNAEGGITKWMIEIKPYKQTIPGRSRNPKTRMYEDYTYMVNQLKWQAAGLWCKERNIIFEVTTEKELFGNRSKR